MDKAIVFGLGLIGQIVIKALKDLDYEVIGVDLSDKSNLIAHHDNLISTEVCDATDENVEEPILKQIFDEYQNPYLLVNALGVDVKVGDSNTFESLDNQNIQNFNKALLHGLTSYFVTSKHFVLNHLKNESLGRILNIASDLSVIAPDHRLYNQKNITN